MLRGEISRVVILEGIGDTCPRERIVRVFEYRVPPGARRRVGSPRLRVTLLVVPPF